MFNTPCLSLFQTSYTSLGQMFLLDFSWIRWEDSSLMSLVILVWLLPLTDLTIKLHSKNELKQREQNMGFHEILLFLKKVCSRSSLSYTPWLARQALAFPERVCGGLSSFKGGLFYMLGSSWTDPHLGQSHEAPRYRDKQMLHV